MPVIKVGPSKPAALLAADFDKLSWQNKRARVSLEQNGRCAGCGLGEWLGKPIILETEHKNGNNSDHRRENLHALCPNCHSQTLTWRGRNRRDRGDFNKRVSDIRLRRALLKSTSVADALRRVGLKPEGGNYKRAQALLDSTETVLPS